MSGPRRDDTSYITHTTIKSQFSDQLKGWEKSIKTFEELKEDPNYRYE